MTDVGDRKQVQRRGAKLKKLNAEDNTDIATLLSTASGRYFIWRILSKCGVYNSAIGLAPQDMASFEGGREIGLWLMAQCFEADEDWYNKTRKEGAARDKLKEKANG